MSGDTLDFLQGTRETLTGTLHDPAATTGHVLTVQADKSIAAAAGGGSQPGAARLFGPFTVTAADIDPLTNFALLGTLKAGETLIKSFIRVTVSFDNAVAGLFVAVGDPAGTFENMDPEISPSVYAEDVHVAVYFAIPETDGGFLDKAIQATPADTGLMFACSGGTPNNGQADVLLLIATPTTPLP